MGDCMRILFKSDLQKGHMLNLTPRQTEIMIELDKGIKRTEIATNLGLTDDCIKWHLNNIYKKLNVKGRADAIKLFRQGPQESNGDPKE